MLVQMFESDQTFSYRLIKTQYNEEIFTNIITLYIKHQSYSNSYAYTGDKLRYNYNFDSYTCSYHYINDVQY